jgi:hypothetical protein
MGDVLAGMLALTRLYREAIAQRDEARGIGYEDYLTMKHRANAAEARLAALDVPRPESEEILAGLEDCARQARRTGHLVEVNPELLLNLLSRLRSLPSEPSLGNQGEAAENG